MVEYLPSISYLRTFGCIEFYHVPKNVRNKLQPSGRKAIMIGYSRERNAYHLYFDIERKSVIEKRNVIFNETQTSSCFLKKRYKKCKLWNGWNVEDFIDNDNDAEYEVSPNVEQGNNEHNKSESDEETEDIEDRINDKYV